MEWVTSRFRMPGRLFGAVVGFTLIMTASLVGIVALVSGETTGIRGRIPYYVLMTAIAFVVTLWKLDDTSVDGVTVLIATSGIAICCGALFGLAVEGLVYGIEDPERIVAEHLVVYFIAAGLICTGLGMWSLRHWREFTSYDNSL